MSEMEKDQKISSATDSRRKFVRNAGITVAVSSLSSKSVFATAVERSGCNISGFQSVNPSGVTRHTGACGGFSHGAWKTPYANGNGKLEQWYAGGIYYYGLTGGAPFSNGFVPPKPSSGNPLTRFNNTFGSSATTPTKWYEIFGSGPSFATTSTSLYDVLNTGGPIAFDRDAAAAFLSSCWLKSQSSGTNFIDPRDIVILHNSGHTMPGGGGTLTLTNGSTINRPSKNVIHNFLLNLQYSNNA